MWRATRPRPSVVRCRVSSWISTGTPSRLSITSNSTQRAPSCLCLAQAGQGILGRPRRGAAMADHRGEPRQLGSAALAPGPPAVLAHRRSPSLHCGHAPARSFHGAARSGKGARVAPETRGMPYPAEIEPATSRGRRHGHACSRGSSSACCSSGRRPATACCRSAPPVSATPWSWWARCRPPSPGELIRAEGAWYDDRSWGRQFRATAATLEAPASEAGLVAYLGSGRIKGVGEELARAAGRAVRRCGSAR